MSGPLAGLKIIEMKGIGPCPLAGQLMADLGAEVIVAERDSSGSRAYDVNSRNKKSVTLDLKSKDGLRNLLALVDTADVLIEGFRPGVMERLGAGPQVCLARNKRLIFGRMTGWGQNGPLSHTAGHDINYLALSGMLHPLGHADRPPVPPLNLVADYGGGSMFLIFGVLAALFERSRSGLGQVVDAAMVDGVSAMSAMLRTMQMTGDWVAQREANLIDGGAPYYGVYETADGKFVSVGAIEPQFFAEFAQKAGLPAELAKVRNRREDWPEQRAEYARIFKGRTREEWETIFAGSDACVSPVLTPAEAVAHPQAVDRNAFVTLSGFAQPTPAPRFSRTPSASPKPPVDAGTNTQQILGAIGSGAGRGLVTP